MSQPFFVNFFADEPQVRHRADANRHTRDGLTQSGQHVPPRMIAHARAIGVRRCGTLGRGVDALQSPCR